MTSANPASWTCPVCQHPLSLNERSYRCDNGHCFDLAKEGYTNLLLAQQKHSANPGDDKTMLRSRREFLEQAYYQPLADRLAQIARELREANSDSEFTVLDSGCGEGWYLGQIAEALRGQGDARLSIHGSDIARDAMRMAAKRYRDLHFAVASNAALPLSDASLQLLLRVFAPGSDAEVTRLLAPGGHFLVVTPGPRHLYALRELVYREPREHEAEILAVEGLEHVTRHSVAFDLTLKRPGDCARLLAMTPYYWQADEQTQAHIASLPKFSTPADFCIDLYRKPD